MEQEMSDVQDGFQKGRGTRDHIADMDIGAQHGILEDQSMLYRLLCGSLCGS